MGPHGEGISIVHGGLWAACESSSISIFKGFIDYEKLFHFMQVEELI